MDNICPAASFLQTYVKIFRYQPFIPDIVRIKQYADARDYIPIELPLEKLRPVRPYRRLFAGYLLAVPIVKNYCHASSPSIIGGKIYCMLVAA